MSYLGSRSNETFLVQEQGELVVVVLCVQVYVCPRPGLVTISIIFFSCLQSRISMDNCGLKQTQ